jgi:hypothetical protein
MYTRASAGTDTVNRADRASGLRAEFLASATTVCGRAIYGDT